MNNKFSFGKEAQEKLLSGIRKVGQAVGSTLGAKGRFVIIQDPHGGSPIVTKDGVTVARHIAFEDVIENIGAMMIKEASINTLQSVGDGTSTSAILAVSMIEQGFEQIKNGMNPVDVKNGISATVDKVIENLKLSAIPVQTPEQIYNVAFISANNDKEIATLIADSIKIAPKGNIIVEESGTSDSYVVEEIGCKYNQGLTNRAFINNKILNKTIYEDCAIIMVDGKLDNINKVAKRLEKLGETNQPVVIIAEDFDNYVLKVLVTNREARGARLAAIKLPGFGDFKQDYKLDIESICNYNHEDDLGWVKKIIVSDESTTFVPYEASMQSISNRLNLLGNQNKNADNLFIKQTLDDRINALIGQTAIIYIGGNSETEVKEKQDRVDDSLKAVKAAIEEGVVAGGGVALINQQLALMLDSSFQANKIVYNVLAVPAKTLLENAGLNYNDYSKEFKKNRGVNILTGKVVDMFEAGIIDPLKVTRIALEKAKSITELILTTNCIIHE